MSEKGEQVSIEELAFSNMWQLEAMISLLEKKGVMTRKELLDEVQDLQVKAEEKRREN